MIGKIPTDAVELALIKMYKVNKLISKEREVNRLEKRAGTFDIAMKA